MSVAPPVFSLATATVAAALLAGLTSACKSPTPTATDASPAASASAPALSGSATPAPAASRVEVATIDIHALEYQARSAVRPDAPSFAAATVELELFLLVAPQPGPTFTGAVKLGHDVLDALFADRFRTPPARPVTVFLFPDNVSYESFCKKRFDGTPSIKRCTATLGFYNKERHELLANLGPGLPTLSHEMVHPLIQADFPRAPLWLNEGLASLFERPVFPKPKEIHGVSNWRLPGLQAAMRDAKRRDGARMDRLFRMSDDAFHEGDEDLHYAVARYLCQWLDEKVWLWPFYRAWRDGMDDDPTGELAFEKATGMAPERAEEDWEAWAGKL